MKAEAAHDQNQRTTTELFGSLVANFQGYADPAANPRGGARTQPPSA
ncbi:MAG: hypothetical protein M0C28_29225 [Candidatus Moduliflexus flocculans]|nr:hypothetical protein [Candidatus Moduliflexus flocculans]